MTAFRSAAFAALAFLALGAAGGCRSPVSRSLPEDVLVARGGYAIVSGVDVPHVRGVEGCGAQALAAVLTYGAPGADATALAEELPWHDAGATPIDLLLTARRHGHDARIERGTWSTLEDHVRASTPAIVMLDVGYTVGPIQLPRVMHWSVVTGVGDDGDVMLLGATEGRHHLVDRDDFLERWSLADNCLIVVTPVR